MDRQDESVTPPESSPSTRKLSRKWRVLLAYLLAAAFLIWVFYGVDVQQILHSVANMRWGWVALAIVFDAASYVCQGVRWSLLLRPVGRISILKATQAIYAGLFASEILPLRAGEALRIYVVSRWMGMRFRSVLSSALVERFLDGIWLAVTFGIVIFFIPLPRYLVDAEEVLALLVLGATALFVFLVLRRRNRLASVSARTLSGLSKVPVAENLIRVIDQIAGGLGDIGLSWNFYGAAVYSGLLLLAQILALWLMMLAYRLDVSFWHGAVVVLVLHLGTAVPSAPSNLGSYQFFTVVGLTIFGIDRTAAAGFSAVAFLILTVPLWAIGSVAFWKAGLSLTHLRGEIPRA